MSRFRSLASAFVVLLRDKTARQLPPSSSYSSSSLVPYKILIHEDEHEDEYEKNQIRSHGLNQNLIVGRRWPNRTSQGAFLVTCFFIFLHHRD
jgi:hypothetical protein